MIDSNVRKKNVRIQIDKHILADKQIYLVDYSITIMGKMFAGVIESESKRENVVQLWILCSLIIQIIVR
jgi:hypothetical protein